MISSGVIAAIVFIVMTICVVLNYLPCIREMRVALARGDSQSRDFTPSARVILCLRGADPFLDRCLRGLANQDYPGYKVVIVVDSLGDGAMPQVEHLVKEFGNDRIEVLIRDRLLPHCSRRASSFFSGLSRIPTETEVVAMCDADAIPHPSWLRELVAPLQDPLTVATFGNRWYAPTNLALGGLCRYYWNSLAFCAMRKYRIPWAGSMAMRGDLFRNPEFLECLQHAFGEDTALGGFLANKPQRVMPIVSLVMLNEETCGLQNFWGFLVRQMLSTRLHHSHWWSVLAEALVIFLVMWVLLPLSIVEGRSSWRWWCAGGVLYDIVTLSLIGYFDGLVRKLLWEQRQQRAAPYDWKRICLAAPSLFLTGLIYPLAAVTAFFTKIHEWRGVIYRVEGRGITTIETREEFHEAAVGQNKSI